MIRGDRAVERKRERRRAGRLAGGVKLGYRRLVSGRHALADEREIVRVLDTDLALRSHYVRIAVGIDRDTAKVFRQDEFRHAPGKAPGVLAKLSDGGFQVRHVFIHLD
jgi:hypothetical protein